MHSVTRLLDWKCRPLGRAVFFFIDQLIATVRGSVKNQDCPVEGVDFRVGFSDDFEGEKSITFESATDEKGRF